MKSLQIYTLCALCATPALVQAQESAEVSKVDAAMARLLDIFACIDTYTQTIDDYLAGKITAVETQSLVENQIVLFEQLKSKAAESIKALSDMERQSLFTEMKGPEIGKRISAQDEKIKSITEKLNTENFTKNAGLKAACENFYKSYLN